MRDSSKSPRRARARSSRRRERSLPPTRDRRVSGLMDERLTALRWDAEYRRGRYADDPPLAFVEDILTVLDGAPGVRGGVGLYVGCGNGRNYLPLVDAGLRIYGLDLSIEALRQLAARRSALPLICGDFRGFVAAGGP